MKRAIKRYFAVVKVAEIVINQPPGSFETLAQNLGMEFLWEVAADRTTKRKYQKKVLSST